MRTLLENRLATLIWDGLPSRRSRKMKEWLATQSEWLVVEQLPAYGGTTSTPSRRCGGTSRPKSSPTYASTRSATIEARTSRR
jgi:hypothetical protein